MDRAHIAKGSMTNARHRLHSSRAKFIQPSPAIPRQAPWPLLRTRNTSRQTPSVATKECIPVNNLKLMALDLDGVNVRATSSNEQRRAATGTGNDTLARRTQ